MALNIIKFDAQANRKYGVGIDMVAFFKSNGAGWFGAPEAFNGVTAFNESPSGAEITKLYADNSEYLSMTSKEEFGGTLEAYDYPENFAACNGVKKMGSSGVLSHCFATGQARENFGLAYRTMIGTADRVPNTALDDKYCKLHLVYFCRIGVSASDHATVNDSPEAKSFSWEMTTEPVTDTAKLPANVYECAHLEIDLSVLDSDVANDIYEAIYGSDVASMPSPKEIYNILAGISE